MRFHTELLALLLALSCSSDPEPPPGGSTTGGQAGGATTALGGGGGGGSTGEAGKAAGGSAGTAAAGGSAGAATAGTGGGVAGGSGAAGMGGGDAGGCGTAIVCDDFEAHALNAAPGAPWSAETNEHGEVVVADGNAYGGSQALRVTTDGLDTYQRAYVSLSGEPLFPAAQNVIWGRMMVYTEAAANDGVHWTMIQAEGPVPGENHRSLIRYGGQHEQRLMANYYTDDAASDCWDHSETAMPQGVWTCMEWHYDAPSDTMRFYLDGNAIDDLTVVAAGEGCGGPNTWNFPEFDKALVGWESYQSDPAREVWIDDVALGTERIGCPP